MEYQYDNTFYHAKRERKKLYRKVRDSYKTQKREEAEQEYLNNFTDSDLIENLIDIMDSDTE